MLNFPERTCSLSKGERLVMASIASYFHFHHGNTNRHYFIKNYFKVRKSYANFLYIELSIWYESLQGPRPLRAKTGFH